MNTRGLPGTLAPMYQELPRISKLGAATWLTCSAKCSLHSHPLVAVDIHDSPVDPAQVGAAAPPGLAVSMGSHLALL
jgi:hypothetical protein